MESWLYKPHKPIILTILAWGFLRIHLSDLPLLVPWFPEGNGRLFGETRFWDEDPMLFNTHISWASLWTPTSLLPNHKLSHPDDLHPHVLNPLLLPTQEQCGAPLEEGIGGVAEYLLGFLKTVIWWDSSRFQCCHLFSRSRWTRITISVMS